MKGRYTPREGKESEGEFHGEKRLQQAVMSGVWRRGERRAIMRTSHKGGALMRWGSNREVSRAPLTKYPEQPEVGEGTCGQ